MEDEIVCAACPLVTIEPARLLDLDYPRRDLIPVIAQSLEAPKTVFSGSEDEALDAGWTQDEYGFLCPACTESKAQAEAKATEEEVRETKGPDEFFEGLAVEAALANRTKEERDQALEYLRKLRARRETEQ